MQLKAEVILKPHKVPITEDYFQAQWFIWSFSESSKLLSCDAQILWIQNHADFWKYFQPLEGV
jgi:hypothetical protein